MTKIRQEPEGFSDFWAIWRPRARHTDGRGLARETFAKHIKAGANWQDIVDGARCFFRTMKDKDREFVPLASTWLNRGAYEDLAEAERAHQARYASLQTNVVPIASVDRQPVHEPINAERRAELAEIARKAAQGMRMQ